MKKVTNISLLSMLLAMLMLSCKLHQEFTARPANLNATNNKPPATPDSLIMSYERTACFGQCPIYKVKIYAGGYATYEGINFVDKVGMHYQQIDRSIIDYLFTEAENMGFFNLPDLYKSPVSDLPSKIIYINYKGRKKQVRDQSAGPDQLKDLEAAIEKALQNISWQPLVNNTK